MKWIVEELKLLVKRFGEEQKEFEQYNSLLVLSRIRLISYAAMYISFFWVYMDWKFWINGAGPSYLLTLIVMHIASVIASAAFLVLYNKYLVKSTNPYLLFYSARIYVFLYILYGALASINSQRYFENIYSYLILSLIAAVAFTLRPLFMFFAFVINHIIFLIGMQTYINDKSIYLTKYVNSTVLIGAAFLIGYIFYRHRMQDFINNKKIRENEEMLKKLFYVNPYPVYITRLEDGTIIEANKRACSMLGISTDTEDPFNKIDGFMDRDNKLAVEKELQERNSVFDKIVEYEFNGKQMWVTANYEMIDYHGEKCILTGIMDITEIHKAEEELSHFASSDSLTGILNRRMGLIKLHELIEKAKKEYLEFVVCFLDINNLKYVNDSFGHAEGDRYILTLCGLINSMLSDKDIFFRLGGDEFIIVCRDKNKHQVEYFWTKVMECLEEKNQKEELPYHIMASHGVYYYCSGMDLDVNRIIDLADQQMYEEKQKHRKEYTLFYDKE